MIPPDDALRILEANGREMAVGEEGVPSACHAEARHRSQSATPSLLDQACTARVRDADREVASPLHSLCLGDIADEAGSAVDGAGTARDDGGAPVEEAGYAFDGAGTARDDDGAAAAATSSAAAGWREPSPGASATSLREAPARDALRNTFSTLNASPVESSHHDGDSSNLHVSALLSGPGRKDWGYVGSVFEPGDEILVERKLRTARQVPLAERRARRYSKLQSFVG